MKMFELQCGHPIKQLQTDNTLEFKKLSKHLSTLGIQHRFSVPYSHQQMGSVERRHRHIIDIVVTLLDFCSLPDKFWSFAVLTTGFLYNLNPS